MRSSPWRKTTNRTIWSKIQDAHHHQLFLEFTEAEMAATGPIYSPHLAVASLIHHCKMSCGGQPWAYLEPSTRASTSHTPVITRLPPSPAATVPIMVDTRMDSHFSLARRIEQSQFSAASSATSDRRIPSGFENYAEKVHKDAVCMRGCGAHWPVCAHRHTHECTLMR